MPVGPSGLGRGRSLPRKMLNACMCFRRDHLRKSSGINVSGLPRSNRNHSYVVSSEINSPTIASPGYTITPARYGYKVTSYDDNGGL